MFIKRNVIYKIFVFITALFLALPAHAAESIKIGEMMSYTGAPDFAYPFREGWQMAVEDYNASGGVNGHPIEVISRDDQADPAVAVRIADELVSRDKVVMLVGAGLNHVGLAVSNYAKQAKIPFIKQWAGSCNNIGKDKNPYWFATAECIEIHAYVYAEEAAKQPYKRWAIIAPNYEYGRNLSDAFKQALKRLKPDVEFVAERYPTLDKVKAQEEIRALEFAKPEAVFNQLFSSDLPQYIRAGEKLGFLQNRFHIGDYIGTPTDIRELGDSYPDGWFTMGMPDNPDQPFAKEFSEKFQTKYHKKPDNVALEGYRMMQFAIESLRKANSLKADKICAALEGLEINSPQGPSLMRAREHQAYENYWVGYTKREKGQGSFVSTAFVKVDDIAKRYNLSGEY